MSAPFSTLLHDFHTAILNGDGAPLIPALRTNPRITPEDQLAIYIDGYRLRLTQAIRSDYPALLAALADKSFDQLALAYIAQHPPAGYNLDRYPHAFAAYVQRHCDNPFATDMAKLEGAIAEVFMMPESAPLDPATLHTLAPEAFGELILHPRHAAKLLAFEYKVDDWLTSQRAGTIAPITLQEANFVYVYRHNNNVQRALLTGAAYQLLKQLFSGLMVGKALDAVMNEHPQHAEAIAGNLQPWFAEWMAKGFFRQP